MALTAKQQKFADEYLIDLNATQAAIRAGYSERTARQIGQQNLSKLDIQKYLTEQMQHRQSATIASADEVLEYLTSVLRGTPQETSIVDEGGVATVEIIPSTKERLRSAELLGKRYGLYTDKVDTTVHTTMDSELAELIRQRTQRRGEGYDPE